MEQHKEGGQKIQLNTQQSGGTGRSSLWMERCQFVLRVWQKFESSNSQLQWVAVLARALPLFSRKIKTENIQHSRAPATS